MGIKAWELNPALVKEKSVLPLGAQIGSPGPAPLPPPPYFFSFAGNHRYGTIPGHNSTRSHAKYLHQKEQGYFRFMPVLPGDD